MNPLWKTVWRFIKKLKIELPYDPTILFLGIYLKKTKNTNYKRKERIDKFDFVKAESSDQQKGKSQIRRKSCVLISCLYCVLGRTNACKSIKKDIIQRKVWKLNENFTKENIQKGNKHVKSTHNVIIIRGRPIKLCEMPPCYHQDG